jgi:hypothetical protein
VQRADSDPDDFDSQGAAGWIPYAPKGCVWRKPLNDPLTAFEFAPELDPELSATAQNCNFARHAYSRI